MLGPMEFWSGVPALYHDYTNVSISNHVCSAVGFNVKNTNKLMLAFVDGSGNKNILYYTATGGPRIYFPDVDTGTTSGRLYYIEMDATSDS